MTPDAVTRRYVELGLYQGQELLVLDLHKCTRCDECVRACADSHDGVTRVVRDGLTGCPVDAIHREGTGLEVRIDDHCIGCGLCAHNCPYGSIHLVETDADGRIREVPKADWPAPSGPAEVPGRTARLRAVNCDLCAGSGTGPRCV